jgi:hypothetical protein
MNDDNFQEVTEDRLSKIEKDHTDIKLNQTKTSTYFSILGGVLALVSLPIFMVAFDMRSAVSLLTAHSETQTAALNKLGEKLDAITINGSPRTVDKIEVNSQRIQVNTHAIKEVDLRLRVIERGSSKQVSSNTDVVDGSENYHNPLISTRELAKLEDVNQDTIRRRIATGEYQVVKVGSGYEIENPYYNMPTVRATYEPERE